MEPTGTMRDAPVIKAKAGFQQGYLVAHGSVGPECPCPPPTLDEHIAGSSIAFRISRGSWIPAFAGMTRLADWLDHFDV